eukprot:5590553-Prymnesium_polylepis.1
MLRVERLGGSKHGIRRNTVEYGGKYGGPGSETRNTGIRGGGGETRNTEHASGGDSYVLLQTFRRPQGLRKNSERCRSSRPA